MSIQSTIKETERGFKENFGEFITLGLGNVSVSEEGVIHHNSYSDIEAFLKQSQLNLLKAVVERVEEYMTENEKMFNTSLNVLRADLETIINELK